MTIISGCDPSFVLQAFVRINHTFVYDITILQGKRKKKNKSKTVSIVMEESGEVVNVQTGDVFMANENVEDDMCKLLHVNEPGE